jgi:hypothetical protein
MARVPVPITVIDTNGSVVSGASVTVRKRSDSSLATLYQAETGATTIANPVSTDSFGRVVAWVDRGAYNAVISGTSITTYTQPFDGAAAADRTLDTLWAPAGVVPTVQTGGTLPASPTDGDEVYYVADATNGVIWHVRYRSAASGSYKWEFVGGGLLYSAVDTAENKTAGAGFGDVATVGPSITVPLAGDYYFEYNCAGYKTSGVGLTGIDAQLKVNATNKSDTVSQGTTVDGSVSQMPQTGRLLALAASDVVKLTYQSVTYDATFRFRRLALRPIRVG